MPRWTEEHWDAIIESQYKVVDTNSLEEYKPTNADRIRAMSDEELADYIFGVSVGSSPCVKCSDDCDFCELSDEECKKKTLEWLQSEAE